MAWRINRVHKWISVVVGAALLVWVVSGVVMILPGAGGVRRAATPTSFEGFTLAPAEVARLLRERVGHDAPIRELRLVALLDRPTYLVTAGRGTYLVDAATGEPVPFTPELALALARRAHPEAEPAGPAELIERHEAFGYAAGPLPVYRIRFADARGTVAYVSPRDGTVERVSRLRRLRNAIHRLHRFHPLNVVVGDAAEKAALHVASAATLAAIATGYWLALRRTRRRPAPDRVTTGVS
ncbi:MAG TPA: PepSY domain-containing protein [Gemmatimonadales bacterium]|nr:PepSY domain-containing protein [Gemmatimonadales bacterium]